MTPPSIPLSSPAKRFAVYWLPVIVLALAIYIQSAYPASESLDSLPYGDKLVHAVVYGVMAFLFARAMNSHARWRGRPIPLWTTAVAVTVLYGLSDEWHQSFVSVRTADALDLLADGIGAVLGAWVCVRLPVVRDR
jgi:VanZ family protein